VAQLNANKLDKAGTVTPTANQPMGGYKHTGAADANAVGQYLSFGQNAAQVGTLTKTGAWCTVPVPHRHGHVADSDVQTIDGVSCANYGITWGNFTSFSGQTGLNVRGYGGLYLSTQTGQILMTNGGDVISTIQITPPALTSSRDMVFNLTSNTNLRISVRGTDGTTRVADITLA
jgi:hypothetical protein